LVSACQGSSAAKIRGRRRFRLAELGTDRIAKLYFGLTGKSERNLINALEASSRQVAVVNDLSSYKYLPLREGDISLYRGSGSGVTSILLATAEEASLDCIERLEHEYALKAELDGDWTVRPIGLARHNDRLALVQDPGGVPLD
jgi:hypothetical protein